MAQEGLGYENYGLDLQNPDFVKYAEAYGARGYRISKVQRPWMTCMQPALNKNAGMRLQVEQAPLAYTHS